MSAIATIKTRLAEIQATITGVKRAYAQAPASLPPGDLPCFINFVGPATHDWSELGYGNGQETRLYLMRLYVKPILAGIDGEAERACEPFFELVRDKFSGRRGLGMGTSTKLPLAEIQQAILLGDNGIVVLPYAGDEFIGIEFRLQVDQDIAIVPVPYE